MIDDNARIAAAVAEAKRRSSNDDTEPTEPHFEGPNVAREQGDEVQTLTPAQIAERLYTR